MIQTSFSVIKLGWKFAESSVRNPVRPPLTATAIVVAALGATLVWRPCLALIWNASGSAPIGLYWVEPTKHVTIGDLVLLSPPEPVARFLAAGGYLPPGVPLIKRVLAVAGQFVCRWGGTQHYD